MAWLFHHLLKKKTYLMVRNLFSSSPKGPVFSISIARLQGLSPGSDHGNVACWFVSANVSNICHESTSLFI